MPDRSLKSLTPPHGNTLIDLIADAARAADLRSASREWPSWDLTSRQVCDLELLLSGAFSPLDGFMTRPDYESVCARWRLASGIAWPLPITLDVTPELAATLAPGTMLALRDPEGVMLAALHVEDVWDADRDAEAAALFGDAVAGSDEAVAPSAGSSCYVGGRIEGLQLPTHHDHRGLRHTPTELRARFAALGWSTILAFQPTAAMHRAEVELTVRAAREHDATLLIQPICGVTDPSDVGHHARMRCFKAIMAEYPPGMALLSLLPFASRRAGAREALMQAIIRKNYGCSHFMLDGRADADRGAAAGADLEGLWQSLRPYTTELGLEPVPHQTMVYVEDRMAYLPATEIHALAPVRRLSDTELRSRLAAGGQIPTWFTPRPVADELHRAFPSRRQQGFTIFFTGLSGSGKSTIANVLLIKLLEAGGRNATLLDGDLVRKHLSSELGFSKVHRDLNVRRIGYVASEITKSGGIGICSPIAPYDATRRDVRRMIAPVGGFVLVYVATPLAVCEQRDRKGLYAKARAGLIPHFTGISDPYEPPVDAEVTVDTSAGSAAAAADQIIEYLIGQDYLASTIRAEQGRAS